MLKSLSDDYKKLKAGSAEFLDLKTKYKKISEQLAEQTKRAKSLDEELRGVEKNQYIKWFLAGSGVLLIGFIVGFAARRGRRRPSLL
jgi:SH3 domain protein